ncbi:MAG: sulfatase-like hydrolase/transferase [Proteobacteria bacterium]|nr:sulfatase-like hydrolase/transferase [Pseudomonadota bacterium]
MKNVVFIMLDSLQFNYLGCYGNEWIRTPNIDRLAREATLFENAYTEGLPTIPCRRAMLTGRYTLPFKGWGPLDLEDSSLGDILWGRGINTAMIYDSAPMQLPKYGYSRGFSETIFRHGHELDHYFYSHDELKHLEYKDYIEDHIVDGEDANVRNQTRTTVEGELKDFLKLRQHWKSEEDNYVAVIAKDALNWLDKVDKTHPFLLWIDSFDPHEPWDPPSVWDPDLKCPYNPEYQGKDQILPLVGDVEGVYTEEEMHHIRMLYAENVTLCDKWIGKVLDKIRELGLWDDTLIVLCSDHGEPMGNGEHGHGIMRKARPWPYEELAHIPFIVRLPGVGEGERVKSFVQSCDVAPTILDFLGASDIEVKHGQMSMSTYGAEEMQGHSVLPLIRGEKEKLRDFAIAGYYGFAWSIIRDDFSYIHWLTEGAESFGELVMKMYDGIGVAKGQFATTMQDDDEMWTCTPGSEVQLPEKDELYERAADPFQLNNVVDKHPEKAKELLQQLKEFMAGLRTT